MELKKKPNEMSQKIFIKTFGCQMNEYDSNRIYDSVKKIGYQKTDNYEEAKVDHKLELYGVKKKTQ